MFAKRWGWFFLALVVGLAFFWKPIFEFGAGIVIRALLAHHEWHLVYDDLKWNGDGFLFRGVQVNAPDIFTLRAEKVSLSLKKKWIEIDAPYLVMEQWKFEDDFPDWKISMEHGTIEDKKIGIARFSMQRLHSDQIAQVIFEREGSQLTLEAIREDEAVRLFTSWRSLQLIELNPWLEMGKFLGGTSEGHAEILFQGGKQQVKSHLSTEGAGIDWGFWKGTEISLECDWEGPLCFSPEVTLRSKLHHAYCQIGESSFELVDGSISSFAGLGAKMELKSSLPWEVQLRTGFGKEAWIEGEIAFKNGSSARIWENSWECVGLGPAEVSFLQAIATPFFPDVMQCVLEEGSISAQGEWETESWTLQSFKAKNIRVSQENWMVGASHFQIDEGNILFSEGYFQTPFLSGSNWEGNEGIFEGLIGGVDTKIKLIESRALELQIGGMQARLFFGWENQHLVARIEQGKIEAFKIDHVTMELIADTEEIHCYDLKGEIADIPLHIPHFAMRGKLWAFDFRLLGPSWDLLRLWGTAQEGMIEFDPQKSHILGTFLQIDSCVLGKEGVESLHLKTKIPLQSLEMAAAILRNKQILPEGWDLSPLKGLASIEIDYEREGASHIQVQGEEAVWDQTPIDLQLILDKKLYWEMSACHIGDYQLRANFAWENGILKIFDAEGNANGKVAHFKACVEPLTSSAQLSDLHFELYFPEKKLGAVLKGKGLLAWDKIGLELTASDLKMGEELIENQTPLSIEYSSAEGLVVTGLNLQNPKGKCRAGALKYDPCQNLWLLNHAWICLPPDFFSFFEAHLPFPLKQNLEILADMEWASDFSSFVCKVKEGHLPIGDLVHHVRDLRFVMKGHDAMASCQWLHEGRPFSVALNMKRDTRTGTLTLRDEELPHPLVIEWGLEKEGTLFFNRIEGCFGGIEPSFYRESNGNLIGSVRFDFSLLTQLLPDFMSEKIQKFRLGSGFELKGRLSFEKEKPSFQGILTGKEIELLGYRFRTLFSQIELSSEKIQLSNLKLSDSAGILQIPSFLANKKEESEWTMEIPTLLLQELRPSLLQKIGESLGPMTPLIIRELKFENFKGILDDPSTYTATGALTFINSYRRMHTVYDLPADVLGLLVGLDQELLIPTCGTLQFEMKESKVHFTELKEAFSQGKRSQFFLIQDEDSPYLDFNGTIHILVKMKQFVLFKFTEFFLISIEGDVTDPDFRLQKKKGFFGL